MALPATIDATEPTGARSPGLGDDQLRALKLLIVDLLGLVTDPTQITAALFSTTAGGIITVVGSTFTVKQLVSTLGTITADTPNLTGTVTWNSSGVTFTGLKLAVTDTASAAASKLIDLIVGSTSEFSVTKAGLITAFRLALAQGTITADAPLLNLTSTWNNAGVTFTALKTNVTDTASAAASLLMDLQVGGVSKFSVDKNGEITVGGNPKNGFGSVGQVSTNNSATPNTQFDLDADVVILRNSSDASVVRYNPGAALTNNILTAGSAANGRDQAGAFSAGSWVHFYWIWNGTTLATLSSATAPPTGPTLPTGYTHWCYAGAVRLNATSLLVKTYIRGNRAFYQGIQNALLDGAATTETAIDVSAFVPPNALSWTGQFTYGGDNAAANAEVDMTLRLVTGVDLPTGRVGRLGAKVAVPLIVPNIGQQIFYLWSAAPNVNSDLDVDVLGYALPNGG